MGGTIDLSLASVSELPTDAERVRRPFGYTDMAAGYADIAAGYADIAAGYRRMPAGYADVVAGYRRMPSGYSRSGLTGKRDRFRQLIH